jgi:DNA-binding response OmpR family regulator
MAQIVSLDDVLDATVLIGKILRKKGHNVQTFTEEDDLISYAETNQIDLAILDKKLIKMNCLDMRV